MMIMPKNIIFFMLVFFVVAVTATFVLHIEENLAFAQNSEIIDSSSFNSNPSIENLLKIFESPQSILEQLSIDFGRDVSTIDLLGFSFGMVAYGIFIWHFYRLIAKREIVSLTLQKYHTGGKRLTSLIVYIAKYVIVFPLVVTAWFFAYSLFMFFLAPDIDQDFVFLIVISLVVAIRMAAYYKEDLSKDLAKMIPFSLLGIFLVNTTLFTIDQFVDRLDDFIPFIGQIAAFVLFAIGVEAVLRILFLIKRKFIPVAETKLKEEIEKTIDEKIDIHVKKIDQRHKKLEEKLENTETAMDDKRDKLEQDLNQKREGLKERIDKKRQKLEENLDDKRDKLEQDLNQKREGLKERIDKKRQKLEENLDDKRDKLEQDLNQKREGLKERIDKKRQKLEEKVIQTESKVDETKTKLEKTEKKLDKKTRNDDDDN